MKSTRAAAAYFRDLYEMFGDWHLAMAAYDAGEGRILKSLQRTGARDFWGLAQGVDAAARDARLRPVRPRDRAHREGCRSIRL